MATVKRYFLVYWESNEGRAGDLVFESDGFPSRDEVMEVVGETSSRGANEDFAISFLYEFSSEADYKEWIKDSEEDDG